MKLILENFRGIDSNREMLKKLPQISFFSYQGSRLSDSDGIAKVFKKANDYLDHSIKNNFNRIVLIQFDE